MGFLPISCSLSERTLRGRCMEKRVLRWSWHKSSLPSVMSGCCWDRSGSTAPYDFWQVRTAIDTNELLNQSMFEEIISLIYVYRIKVSSTHCNIQLHEVCAGHLTIVIHEECTIFRGLWILYKPPPAVPRVSYMVLMMTLVCFLYLSVSTYVSNI